MSDVDVVVGTSKMSFIYFFLRLWSNKTAGVVIALPLHNIAFPLLHVIESQNGFKLMKAAFWFFVSFVFFSVGMSGDQTMALEEQVRSLSEELMQCQVCKDI